MCTELGGVPWLFHGFDEALDPEHAWRDVTRAARARVGDLGRLDPRARPRRRRADRALRRSDPRVAELVLAGGGLTPDLVPWLVRAGVRRFAIGSSARSSGSWTRASVDVDHVRSWRMLLDDALSRALGIPAD